MGDLINPDVAAVETHWHYLHSCLWKMHMSTEESHKCVTHSIYEHKEQAFERRLTRGASCLRGIWESPIRMSLALMMNIINSGFVCGSASLCFFQTHSVILGAESAYNYLLLIHVRDPNANAELRVSFHLVLVFSDLLCCKKPRLFTVCQRMLHQPWASWNNEATNNLLFDSRPIMWRCQSGPVCSAVCGGVKDPVCTVGLRIDKALKHFIIIASFLYIAYVSNTLSCELQAR